MSTKLKHIKKILVFLIFILLLIPLTVSCNNSKFAKAYAIVFIDKDPYLLNSQNETYSLSKYYGVGDIFGDLTVVYRYKGDKAYYGYIDRSGNEVIKLKYEMAYPFSEGYAVVVDKGIHKIINTRNKVVYTFPNDIKSYSYFKEGFLRVETNDGFSFLNKNFELCSESFYYVDDYNESRALVLNIVEGVKKYNFLDTNFNKIFTNELSGFDYVESYSSGYAKVGYYISDNYYYSYIDYEGDFLIDENGNQKFVQARTFHDGKAVVFTGVPYYSFYTSTGEFVADYYSYQYLNNDGTYPAYNYRNYRTDNIDNIDLWGHFGDFIGNVTTIKTFSSGAGKWSFFQDEIIDDEHQLSQLTLFSNDSSLTLLEKEYYKIPYDIPKQGKSIYYDENKETILFVVKVSTGYVGLVTSTGEYLTKALYDNIIF